MGKVLLTSSQVSVLVSGTVIVLCTFALFLSGYVIQQRTLQQLRVAIKPRPSKPSPKVYLPDRFKATTTELEDGTIVYLESEAERESREQQEQQQRLTTIEVKETMPDHKQTKEEKASIIEQFKKQIAGTKSNAEHANTQAKAEKPISRAQRRKQIKEEIQRLAQAEEPVYYQRRLW